MLVGAGRLPGGGPEAVEEVIASAQAGDQRAAAALDDVADWLAVGLRAVVNVFNPEIVVFGDSLALIWDARASRVEERSSQMPLVSPRDQVLIASSKFAQSAPLVGAAELAFDELLADPTSFVTVS